MNHYFDAAPTCVHWDSIILNKFILSALIMVGLCGLMSPVYADTTGVLSADETIIVGGDHAFPPYEFLDNKGRPAGYNVDLIRAVTEVMDLKIEIRLGPWSEMRDALENREINALMGMFYSEERSRLIDFSVPHTILNNAVFIRKDYEGIKALEDLRGKEIIVQEGDIMHDYAIQQGLSDILILTDSPDEALRLLASGKNDCALLLERQGLFLVRRFKLTNIITTGPPFSPNEYCFAVQKDDHELLGKLNEGLRIIKATGSYKEIFNKWLGGLQPQGISPIKVLKWAALVAGLLFAVLTGMLLWSWSLQKNIRIATKRLSQELIERRHILDALQESEEKYRSLFNGIPIGLYRTTPSGKIVDANSALMEMFGYPNREDLLNLNSRDLYLDENDREQFMSEMEKDGIVRGFEVRMKRHDKTIRWIRNSGRIVRDDGGAVLFYEGSVEDITEHKHVREALEKEIAFSTTLIQDSPTYNVAIDAQGKTIMMNQTLLHATGYSLEEVKGVDYLNTFVPEQEREMLSEVFQKIVHMKEPTVNENHILTKDGRQHLVEWYGRPVFKTDGELDYFFGVGIDITQRKQAQEERQRLENRLQQSYKMEALGTLAGGIAHDFNNILSSVLGFTELAKIKLTKGKGIEKELDEVLKAGARARDLVKQILTFSRQSGIQKSPIEITSMIKETLKFLRASLPTTIEIKQNLPSYETTIMADPTQIHQVIMNLCTNAAYAMKEKGGVIDIQVTEKELTDKAEPEYKGLAPGRYLQLSIADTGSGIPGDIINRIFDPFFTTKERGEGTGMGLSVVHGIIHNLGGSISVYSEPYKGTAFHLLLPRYIGERSEPFSPHSIVTMGKGRILFVDDEEGVIASGKEILENIGYTITPTTSASDALEIFRSGPDAFDLILTDMTMPKMTGIELSGHMLAIRPDIPIVLCTGSDIGVNLDMIRAAGIREMVMKPMTTNELAEAVYNALKPVNGYNPE